MPKVCLNRVERDTPHGCTTHAKYEDTVFILYRASKDFDKLPLSKAVKREKEHSWQHLTLCKLNMQDQE